MKQLAIVPSLLIAAVRNTTPLVAALNVTANGATAPLSSLMPVPRWDGTVLDLPPAVAGPNTLNKVNTTTAAREREIAPRVVET